MSLGRKDGNETERLLEFWFGPHDADPETAARHRARWFSGGEAFDREVEARFGALHARAAAGELDDWADGSRGRLALIILLDQLTRNLYRGTADAFALDGRAFALAESGIAQGLDRRLTPIERVFFYMPYQHVESRDAQQRGVELFDALLKAHVPEPQHKALEGFARYAREHCEIVSRFGRFPHRNDVLGRDSTDAERDYLEGGAPRYGQ